MYAIIGKGLLVSHLNSILGIQMHPPVSSSKQYIYHCPKEKSMF